MERHLGTREFFVAERYTIADIALYAYTLYAYTHVAGEAGFDLAAHPRVRAWLDIVAAQPGHVLISA
jgi:glutathione S-transferase